MNFWSPSIHHPLRVSFTTSLSSITSSIARDDCACRYFFSSTTAFNNKIVKLYEIVRQKKKLEFGQGVVFFKTEKKRQKRKKKKTKYKSYRIVELKKNGISPVR